MLVELNVIQSEDCFISTVSSVLWGHGGRKFCAGGLKKTTESNM